MRYSRMMSIIVVAVVIAIGCGSGKPQDAAAKVKSAEGQDGSPLQLAQAPAAAQPTSTSGSASVKGTIRFQGTPPAPTKIKMDADPACLQQHSTSFSGEDVVVNSQGMLKNVFVYVKEGVKGSFPASSAAVKLDQAGCWYHPHVFGIQVNQPLEIINSDQTDHNINAISSSTNRTIFNVSQPRVGVKMMTKKFTKPEVMVRLKCNIHSWMHAYAGVLEHPFFAVSDENGAFTLAGLPAGTYVIEAWHEQYGTQTQSVTVADGESKSIDFTFKAQ